MTDNLDLMEQGLENLNIAGNVGEIPPSFLLSFLKSMICNNSMQYLRNLIKNVTD
jgi:hypothetical protein